MTRSIGPKDALRLLGSALIVAVLLAGWVAGSASAHPYVFTDDCGYSGCHNGAPIPGTETTATETTTCVPAPPALKGKARRGKRCSFGGALSSVPSTATTITVYFERKVGKSFKPWSHINVVIQAGAQTYAVRPKFPKRGTWRARARHVEADLTKSTSAWRSFKVR